MFYFRVLLLCLFFVNVFAAYLPPVMAKDGMVVTGQYLASDVGAKILREGGNAMDAAVAVGYALAVVHPCCGNIGGGGFMLVHWHDGQNSVLDFRETAPEKLNADLFSGKHKHPKKGYLYVGVPGTVMGLNTALKKYGTMPLKKVMAPAIKLARNGFVLNRFDLGLMDNGYADFKTQKNVSAIFLQNGKLMKPGQRLIQKELANTLQLISEKGSPVFYEGSIAKAIVQASKKHQGVLSLSDFKHYKAIWRQPLSCDYRGFTVMTAPPPSSGVTICEILKIVEKYPLRGLGFHSATSINDNAQAMKQAFYDRNTFLGDPAFTKNPVKKLLSPLRIQAVQQAIDNKKLKIPLQSLTTNLSMHTTHYVVADKYGNVVSTTYTINSYFGAKIIAGNTGFFLNNEVDDFALSVKHPNQFKLIQGKANLVEPGKRPLSSMSPTIVFRNNKPFLALGAAGGPTIITTLAQAIENRIDYQMDIRAAIDRPRYHMQWIPAIIYMEPFCFSKDTRRLLIKMGYHLQPKLFGRFTYWGNATILQINKNFLEGAADNRGPNGRAVGVGHVTVLHCGIELKMAVSLISEIAKKTPAFSHCYYF